MAVKGEDMQKRKYATDLDLAGNFMFAVCALTSIGYAGFFMISVRKIIGHFRAAKFLESVERVPPDTKLIFILVILMVCILSVDLVLRTAFPKNQRLMLLTLIADMVACCAIVILLDFNFNGIILWFFAGIISKMEGRRHWYPTIAIAILVYLLTYPAVATVWMRAYTLSDFLTVYTSSTQVTIQLIFNFMNILCVTSFFLICVIQIVSRQRRLEEINRLADQLSDANARLRHTNHQMEELMEDNAHMAAIRERNRIAREVHDTIGHTLTGLAFGIDACEALSDGSPEELKDQLNVLSDVAREGIEDVRKSVALLKADDPEDENVVDRIQKMIDNTKKATKTEIAFECEVGQLTFDGEESHAIYRIVQEGVTNAIQHGHAKRIQIVMRKEGERLFIRIQDDGIGCPNPEEGFGLRHMRERVRMLHGTISFDGSNGFLINAVIPLRWREKNDKNTDSR